MNKKCIICGVDFCKSPKAQKLCSRKCRSVFLRDNHLVGNKNVRWNGGRGITTQGYIEVVCPDGYSKNTRGRILEHRLVMEKTLGRKILRTEIVHHINHDKQDNRIENLELLNGQSDHMKEHKPTSETKQKISLSLRGRVFSNEHRSNLRLAALDRYSIKR